MYNQYIYIHTHTFLFLDAYEHFFYQAPELRPYLLGKEKEKIKCKSNGQKRESIQRELKWHMNRTLSLVFLDFSLIVAHMYTCFFFFFFLIGCMLDDPLTNSRDHKVVGPCSTPADVVLSLLRFLIHILYLWLFKL